MINCRILKNTEGDDFLKKEDKKNYRRRQRRKRARRRRRWLKRNLPPMVATAVLACLMVGCLLAFCQEKAEPQKATMPDSSLTRLSAGVNAEFEQSMRGVLTSQTASMPPEEPTIIPEITKTSTPEMTSSPKTEVAPGEAIWTGWAYFESGEAGWEQVGGDGGNAYGRFQLDARHSLPAFLRYAAETNPDFVGLERYYRKNGDRTTMKSTDGLNHDWTWLCAVYDEEFYQVQAEFAYGTFYCLMRDELQKECQINLDEYGPVLKGTVWSVAVRNGNNLSSLYSVTDTYYPGIPEEEWLREIYAVEEWRHPDQTKRWGDGQLNAALETLEMLESGAEVEFHKTFEKDAVGDTARIELLSLAGDYRDFVRYTGRVIE